MLDIIPSEIPKALTLVSEVKDQLVNTIKLSDNLLLRVNDSESTHKVGVLRTLIEHKMLFLCLFQIDPIIQALRSHMVLKLH